MSTSRGLRRAFVTAVGAALLTAFPCHAAEAPRWQPPISDRAVEAARRGLEGASKVWRSLLERLGGENPSTVVRLEESDLAFVAALETAGLTLIEIRPSASMLHRDAFRFVASRLPSTQDLDRARLQLSTHRERHGGLRAAAQQEILKRVIDTAAAGRFVVVDLDVEVSLWPSVRYTLGPRAHSTGIRHRPDRRPARGSA